MKHDDGEYSKIKGLACISFENGTGQNWQRGVIFILLSPRVTGRATGKGKLICLITSHWN